MPSKYFTVYPPLQTKQARAGKKQPIRNRTFGFINFQNPCTVANSHLSTPFIEPNFYVQLPHRRGSTVSLETIPFRNRICRHPRHNFSADTQEVLRGLTLLVV